MMNRPAPPLPPAFSSPGPPVSSGLSLARPRQDHSAALAAAAAAAAAAAEPVNDTDYFSQMDLKIENYKSNKVLVKPPVQAVSFQQSSLSSKFAMAVDDSAGADWGDVNVELQGRRGKASTSVPKVKRTVVSESAVDVDFDL